MQHMMRNFLYVELLTTVIICRLNFTFYCHGFDIFDIFDILSRQAYRCLLLQIYGSKVIARGLHM